MLLYRGKQQSRQIKDLGQTEQMLLGTITPYEAGVTEIETNEQPTGRNSVRLQRSWLSLSLDFLLVLVPLIFLGT